MKLDRIISPTLHRIQYLCTERGWGRGGGGIVPPVSESPLPPQEGEIPASLHLLLSVETLCGCVEANKLLLSVTSE